MNLQTITTLEDALTAFGAGKEQSVLVEKDKFDEMRKVLNTKKVPIYFFGTYVWSFKIDTPGGFVITVIEKP